MPHDIKGNRIEVGDTVSVLCTVKEIHNTEEYCNVTLETCQRMYPGDNKSNITLNAKQVEKV